MEGASSSRAKREVEVCFCGCYGDGMSGGWRLGLRASLDFALVPLLGDTTIAGYLWSGVDEWNHNSTSFGTLRMLCDGCF